MLTRIKYFTKIVFSIVVIGLIGWAMAGAFNSDSNDYNLKESSNNNSRILGSPSYFETDFEDEYYEEEKERPDGTYTVEACSQNSGNCYDLDADISDGNVDTIYFPNGGYLDVDAELDEDGYGEGSSYNGDNWEINCYDCE